MISSLIEISENKMAAVEELCVENVLLKETPTAAILFDDAVDKVTMNRTIVSQILLR